MRELNTVRTHRFSIEPRQLFSLQTRSPLATAEGLGLTALLVGLKPLAYGPSQDLIKGCL